MNSKWYASTLFLILFILLGAFKEKNVIPNQEIILEFVDTKTNKKDIKNIISDVKESLLKIGVEHIVIHETKNKKLKISYFSSLNVKKVKEVLLKENQLTSNKKQNNRKNKNTSSNYNIDINEIINDVDISNLEDKFVFEIKYNSDRFTTNNSIVSLKNIELNKANQLFKTAYKTNKKNPFSKDRTSYKEPEVRAGPNNYKI